MVPKSSQKDNIWPVMPSLDQLAPGHMLSKKRLKVVYEQWGVRKIANVR